MRSLCKRFGLAHGFLRILHQTASLRFQPTKRPQLSTQKQKSKVSLQKTPASAPTSAPTPTDIAGTSARISAKTTLADWTAEREDNDVNGFYGGEKRQRGGRKKRKKNKEESQVPQNWDDIYDPSRPNNYEEYKHSDEKIMELREWQDRLYEHRMAKRRDSDSDSSDANYRPQLISTLSSAPCSTSVMADNDAEQFAPPGMSFAPPLVFEGDAKPAGDLHEVNLTDDSTGEDAYARRMRLSGLSIPAAVPEPLPTSRRHDMSSPPPPPPSAPDISEARKPLPPPALTAPAPPSIFRAPVRYNLPAAPSEIPKSEAELESALQTDQFEEEDASANPAPRSLRPGQRGFAERLMSKYGWSKGSGLGASGSGIVNPLRVQVEKQKKKPDSEGGGFVGPGGRGKIVGGKKKGADSEDGRFGAMSEVIILRGMVDGMNLDAEMEESGDGGLMQEIGEECGEKVSQLIDTRLHGILLIIAVWSC